MPEPRTIPAKRGFLLLFLVVGLPVLALVVLDRRQLPLPLAVGLGLLGALFVYAAIKQWVKPLPFATLSSDGLAFPLRRIRVIPWSRILDVQVGPRVIPNAQGRTLLLRDPIVLRLAPGTETAAWQPRRMVGGTAVAQPDGTVEQLIDTASCAVSTPDLVAEIGKWRPVAVARHLAPQTSPFAVPQPSKPRQRFVAAVAVFIGLVFATVGVLVFRQWARERTWSTSSAVIVSTSTTWVSDRSRASGGRPAGHFEPHFVYRYHVNHRDFTGRNSELSYPGNQPALDAFLAQYRPGTTVTIRYDPADPTHSVLGNGSFLLPLVFTAVGLGVLLLGLHQTRRAWRRQPAG